jgi:hypothetical protein
MTCDLFAKDTAYYAYPLAQTDVVDAVMTTAPTVLGAGRRGLSSR